MKEADFGEEVEMRTGGIIAIVIVAIIVIAAAVWLGLGYALSQGAGGPAVSEERPVAGFSKVDVSGSGTLLITTGPAPALRIDGPKDVVNRIESDVDGDTLHIGQRWSLLRFGPFWNLGEVTYHLTVPELTSIEMSGAVTLRAENPLEGAGLVIKCSGSSDIDLDVQLDDLSVDTSGSADVTLGGAADSTTYKTSGSAGIRALQLVSRAVTIDSSGSSNVEVNVSESLTVKISGSSTVSYVGDPVLDTDISGSGEIKKLER